MEAEGFCSAQLQKMLRQIPRYEVDLPFIASSANLLVTHTSINPTPPPVVVESCAVEIKVVEVDSHFPIALRLAPVAIAAYVKRQALA